MVLSVQVCSQVCIQLCLGFKFFWTHVTADGVVILLWVFSFDVSIQETFDKKIEATLGALLELVVPWVLGNTCQIYNEPTDRNRT